MKRLALVLVAAAALTAAGATASEAQAPTGRFVVQFSPPRNADERVLVQLLRAAQLPQVFTELGKHLKLPRNITIRVQGGADGRYYNPTNRTIILNHPFSALVLNVFQQEYPKITAHRAMRLSTSGTCRSWAARRMRSMRSRRSS